MRKRQNSLIKYLTVLIDHNNMVGARTEKHVFCLLGMACSDEYETEFVFYWLEEFLQALRIQHFCCAVICL